MKLYEHEGKVLFKACGISVPRGVAVKNASELDGLLLSFESTAVKAQVLTGGRGKAGGIKLCHGLGETKQAVTAQLGATIHGEVVETVLIEELVQHSGEYYIGIAYDTTLRVPVLMASREGGIDIESAGNVARVAVDLSIGYSPFLARETLFMAGFDRETALAASSIFGKLWQLFKRYDCTLVEINPLHSTNDGELLADDAKVILDDTALWRHKDVTFPPRKVFGREENERERAAKAIDREDTRGVAGSVYFDLDGDIAILGIGGGGLLSGMDVLLAHGLHPANYTEYSGNPPAEKVKALTKIVLSKPGLRGLWHFGGTANLTDVYETMVNGFYTGLLEVTPKPTYPIVIRRGGPRDKEAFAWLKEHAAKDGFNIHFFDRNTPITESGKKLAELVQ
ncbi:MAG: Succinyl-CoA synthetase, beta subunit [Parcubacteria group bacterium GW2011_GWA2_47_8]|nr:MAG: Succinyl-CoA synthetase, beta subunit [Parcubacteria group bacterium GW2011_GWA2_47_8]